MSEASLSWREHFSDNLLLLVLKEYVHQGPRTIHNFSCVIESYVIKQTLIFFNMFSDFYEEKMVNSLLIWVKVSDNFYLKQKGVFAFLNVVM